MAFDYGFSPYNNQRQYQRNQRVAFVKNNGNGYRPSQVNYKKHSGCTSGTDKNGKRYVRGWKFSKRSGLMTFFAAPYKGTKETTSDNGRKWQNWIAKLQNQQTFEERIMPCLYDVQNNKVILDKIGFVMNPKGGRGGYVGTFTNR